MVQPLVSPWRAVGSSQEVHTLGAPSAARQAMHSLEAKLAAQSGCSRLLPLSAADLADLTRGIPALRLNPPPATADVANLTRSVSASRQEVLLKHAQRLEAFSAAELLEVPNLAHLLEVPNLANLPSADLLAAP